MEANSESRYAVREIYTKRKPKQTNKQSNNNTHGHIHQKTNVHTHTYTAPGLVPCVQYI